MPSALLQPLSDEHIKREAERQVNRTVEIRKIHVSEVRRDHTVFHEGRVMTVCKQNLGGDSFIGPTLFGDSYILGLKPVQLVVMKRAMPPLKHPTS